MSKHKTQNSNVGTKEMQPIRILAIETSCDETSASVVEGVDFPEIKTNIIASQIDIHKLTGGVVPEVAARAHCEQIIPVIELALGGKIHEKIRDPARNALRSMAGGIDAIAVTVGPGLVGSLLVGVETAKALGFAAEKPLIPINHLEGHIFAALAANNFQFSRPQRQACFGGQAIFPPKADPSDNFQSISNSKTFNSKPILKSKILNLKSLLPALALVVSGGHTELVLIKEMFDYEIIGQTLDDAAGEAFDKVASLLGLEYPGGPEISKLAEEFNENNQDTRSNNQITAKGGIPQSIKIKQSGGTNSKFQIPNSKLILKSLIIHLKSITLPRPMLKSGDLNFSFSGLKTAVVNLVRQLETEPVNRSTHLRSGAIGLKSDGISSGVAGSTLPRWLRSEIAYEFQEAVVEVLLEKTWQAITKIQDTRYKQKTNSNNQTIKSILLTGGVSANKRLREAFQKRFGEKLLISPLKLCGDNAGMIGLAAFYRYKKQIFNSQFSRPQRQSCFGGQAVFNKFSSSNDQYIHKSKILNLKSHFAWQNVNVDPNLEL